MSPDMDETITTDVDSLINIVKNKKRISFDDAAKKLKLPTETIEAWAAFLEEEGTVSIDYKFTTPYLVEKSMERLTGSEDDPDFIQINNLLKEAQKSIEEGNVTSAKETYYKIIDKINTMQNSFKDEALKKEPQAFNSINDKLMDIEAILEKAEKHISKGDPEEAKKMLNTVHPVIQRVKAHVTTIKQNVKPKAHPPAEKKIKSEEHGVKAEPEEEHDITKTSEAPEKATSDQLQQAYDMIKKGKFDDARTIHASLQKFLDRLPYQYSEQKKELHNDLLKLNRDLEINFEKKFSAQVNTLSREVNKSFTILESLTKKAEIKKAEKELKRAESLINKIPNEFLQVKSELETKMLTLNQELIRKKQEVYSVELQQKTTEILIHLNQADEYIKTNETENADKEYQQAKDVFKTLPEGFLEQKLALQSRLMSTYKNILLSDQKSSHEKMKRIFSEIQQIIQQTKQVLQSGNLTEALKMYDEANKRFNEFPDGFLKECSALQDEIITIHEIILEKKNEIMAKEMETKTEKIYNLLKLAEGYINKQQYDLANEIISELTNTYALLPEGFFQKKIEMHTKILDLSKQVMIESDRTFLNETDETTKNKYNSLLKLIVNYHEHIEMEEFNLLETTYVHIMILFNQLPVGFVTSNIKIRKEIQKIKDTVDLYKKAIEAHTMIRHNHKGEAQKALQLINNAYQNIFQESPEDKNLFMYIKHVYDNCVKAIQAVNMPQLETPREIIAEESARNEFLSTTVARHLEPSRTHVESVKLRETIKETPKETAEKKIEEKKVEEEKPEPEKKEEQKQEDSELSFTKPMQEKEQKQISAEGKIKQEYRIASLRQHIMKDIEKGDFRAGIYNLKQLIKLDSETTWEKRILRIIEKEVLKQKGKKKQKKRLPKKGV